MVEGSQQTEKNHLLLVCQLYLFNHLQFVWVIDLGRNGTCYAITGSGLQLHFDMASFVFFLLLFPTTQAGD